MFLSSLLSSYLPHHVSLFSSLILSPSPCFSLLFSHLISLTMFLSSLLSSYLPHHVSLFSSLILSPSPCFSLLFHSLPAVQPYFESTPQNAVAFRNQAFVFSCKAAAYPPVTYKWSRQGITVDASSAGVYAVREGQLLISPVQSFHAGPYVCSVSNSIAALSSEPSRLVVFGKLACDVKLLMASYYSV